MSNQPSDHERYLQERSYARHVRAQQGRTTDLDRAEVRYERLLKRLHVARILVPLTIGYVAFALSGPTAREFQAVVVWVLGVNIVSAIGREIGSGLFGDGFGAFVKNAIKTLGGLILIAANPYAPALLSVGVVMAATPTLWWLWVRNALANSAYVRLMRQAADADLPPRIIE